MTSSLYLLVDSVGLAESEVTPPERISKDLKEDWAFDKYNLGKMKWEEGAFQTEKKHKQMQRTSIFRNKSFNGAGDRSNETWDYKDWD